ncbi:sarcoma Ras-like superfamily of small guanosine triphosphatase GTPase [Fusarium mexicanum]|uniref:Sarcoma Ras-like superfamily of small guanosine triphosphatase GTPase n=1 Tax=Fusarium mexicanum TaxID=751941 RepID=A0A8H5N878_9HYPO|nr:sarcoma Ras-like superfamily of small guanosine triphosphatase GTPase [Fusarium mexicanum]
MADNAIDPAVQAQHDALIQQLQSEELRGQVKVILIVGYAGAGKSNLLKLLTGVNVHVGHGIESGTLDALCVLTTLEDEQFLFIDTPGFGASGYSESKVIRTIQATLGFATRCFGGIHGVLYVHSIMTEREYEGMTQCLKFLRSLKAEDQLPSLTIVATNWDTVTTLRRRPKYERKVTELENTSWKEFTDHGYIEFGFSYDDEDVASRVPARAAVVTALLNRYAEARVVPVKMPFWEWTWGEIGNAVGQGIGCAIVYPIILAAAVVTSPVWLPIVVLTQEFERGNIRVGVTSTGNVVLDHNGLGRAPWGDRR